MTIVFASTAEAQAVDWTVLPVAETAPSSETPATLKVRKGDTVWDGVLIGGAVAAVGGMIVAPYALCGNNDSECSVIVRAAVGIPMLAGGLVAGGLVDKFHVQGPVVWRNRSGNTTARVGTFRGGGAGVQWSVRFK